MASAVCSRRTSLPAGDSVPPSPPPGSRLDLLLQPVELEQHRARIERVERQEVDDACAARTAPCSGGDGS